MLGLLLFLLFINNLPESVKSDSKLFADDCLMYCTINTHSDVISLQQDINNVEQWGNTLQTNFNADKCFTVRITNNGEPVRARYKIHAQQLKLIPNSKYPGTSKRYM